MINEFRDAESLDAALIRLDREGNFLYGHSPNNKEGDSILEILGLDSYDGSKSNFLDYLRSEDYTEHDKELSFGSNSLEQFIKKIEQLLDGKINNFEMHPEKNGNGSDSSEEKYHFHFYGIPSKTPDGKEIYDIFITDQSGVTKFKRLYESANEQLERLAGIGEVTTRIVHKIKNPLTSMGGFAKRLVKNLDDDKLLGYSQIILDEVKRLQDITESVLDYVRKPQMNEEDLDLNTLAKELYKTQGYGLVKNPKIILNLESNISILGDKKRLYEVFLNLTENALEEQGVQNIEMRTYKKEGYAVFEVIDDGKRGLPPEIKEEMFGLFFTTKKKGTGIGLDLSKKYVDYHNGRIDVDRVEGKTILSVYLPLKK